MIVSWDWLSQYVRLDAPVEEVAERLTMSGLNLEHVTLVDGDPAIDLEVTSNRPDCLGHIGIAREASVLFERELTLPAAQPATRGEKTATVTCVANECDDLCPQYFARVIRGVKVGPSPDWLRRRLHTVGLASINNIVDVTNYVLLECGQPLHAFDFDKLHGGRIVVRRARAGEKIVAIDHQEYALSPETCVIADADRAIAVGGVMGGFDTEIGEGTTTVLIETAEFTPLSIRNTARKLNLHSPSSYRFERGVDRFGLDWASRRCCELILELAGGELLDDPVFAGRRPEPQSGPISLRYSQLARILGIEIPQQEAVRILTSLGLRRIEGTEDADQFMPPSWRRDLSREIDLIEEVARIHGYEKIPEDTPVPLRASSKSKRDRIVGRVADVLTAAGMYEAITFSFVSNDLQQAFQPFGERPLLTVEHSSRRQDNVLRQSLIPSLLYSRRENEKHGNFDAQLFEVAHVFLEGEPNRPEHEVEPIVLGIVSGRSFQDLKGVIEALARRVNHSARVTASPSAIPQFAPGRGAELLLEGLCWGWLGELDRSVTDRLDLRDAVTVAEVSLHVLEEVAELAPVADPLPQYPAIRRDLNFVLDEGIDWEQLEGLVRRTAGPLLDTVSFGGQYRGPQIPGEKKSYVVTIDYRSQDRTLTNEEVDEVQRALIHSCEQELGATLR